MTTTAPLHPHIESLLHSITSVTGHAVAFEEMAAARGAAHPSESWEVVGNGGNRYGMLHVRAAESLSSSQRMLYAQLSRMIAHEADLRREKSSLENRFRRLDRHNAELTAMNRSLSTAAYRDSLTGLYRRWYLSEQLRLELLRASRHRSPLSLLLIDVVGFTMLTERFGPAGADGLLRDIAARILRTTRTSDVVARLAGDVFAALLPGTPGSGARELARRISHAVATEPFACGSELVQIAVMSGCVTVDASQSETAESFLETAAQSLNRAKHSASAV